MPYTFRRGDTSAGRMWALAVRRRNQGFAAHLSASVRSFRSVRALTAEVLAEYDVDADAAESAQLVVSELAGNSVRALGDHVPLVVEVYATAFGVAVNVHDPDPVLLPRRRAVAPDSAEAESGWGLALLDLLAPGWQIRRSAIGKQIRCHLAR
ncbi:ATP-binding protein [Streptomyces sp. GC420]|uniref:ATP-binding protein n=1 Tax=Streptomyces sp. GC420 TaxID=2697568 RepID=UPI001415195B|nr:ATP-binding protein [Streptomyces sp. GC420]NBM14776.1 ATP-binding protein [Streptomyces sp. GC420]